MQYHAMSLLQASERNVRIFGYMTSMDAVRSELQDAAKRGRVAFTNIPQTCACSVSCLLLSACF